METEENKIEDNREPSLVIYDDQPEAPMKTEEESSQGAEGEEVDAPMEEDDKEAAEKATEKSIEQLKKFTEEDEDLYSATKTLRSILGGDFLTADLVRRQILLVVLIFACFFIHISLRYMNQKEMVEIDKLKQQLEDSRFNALTRFSELTAKSRQSYIEQFLKQNNDSTLETATHPPFIIHLHGDNGDFTAPEADVPKDKQGAEEESNEQDEVIEE